MVVPTPGPETPADARAHRPWGWIALGLVIVGAGVGWLAMGLPGERSTAAKGAAPRTGSGAPPYVAAEHADGDASRLVPAADGKGLLEVVLRDAVEGEKLKVTLRAGADPKAPTVFVDRGDPKSSIGVLHATSEGTGKPAETRLSIELPSMPDRVTVVDLRFGGKWQGFEVKASK